MGDAAGIGAEIVLKALADENLKKICQPVIIGDAEFLTKTAQNLNLKFDFVEAGENLLKTKVKRHIYDLENLTGEIKIGRRIGVDGKGFRRIYRNRG